MSRLHLYLLCGSLAITGAALFLYKVLFLHFPLHAQSHLPVWTIDTRIEFEALDRAAKLELFIPKNTVRFAIMDESFISRGYALSTAVQDYNRVASWSIRKASGSQSLYYRAVVRALEQKEEAVYKQPQLEDPGFSGAELEAARTLLALAHAHSGGEVELAASLIKVLIDPQADQNARLLLGKKPDDLSRAALVVRILALEGIVARQVHGINLQSYSGSTKLIHWLELYQDKRWVALDARNGERWISSDYLPWWRGSLAMAQLEGGKQLRTSVAFEPRDEEAIEAALARVGTKAPWVLEYSLFSLPIEAQSVYRVLLMIPLGALLVVLLRNVVGIRTFGTFMPILVALAFRETGLLWGLLFFALLVGCGLLARLYLESLKLLLVPRLAAILTVIIVLMAAGSVICNWWGIGHGLSVALFPMVIMTMCVERMSIVWDELGAAAALRQAFATLFAASLIYLLIRISLLAHLFFVFPETILIVLAVTLLLGRYTGYRLLELRRFRDLARTSHA